MADPFTVIGIASSIVQLVDFSSKLVSESKEIYRSANGALSEHTEIESVAADLSTLSQRVSASVAARVTIQASSSLFEDEARFQQLAASCHEVSQEILTVLQDLKTKEPHQKWHSFRQAVKGVWNKERIQDLEKRLERIRGEILIHLVATMR